MTWREKLQDDKDFPRVEAISEKAERTWGPGTIVIPKPIEVDELMRKVPKGRLTTINDIRAILAERHGSTIACPICTGIFASISARAAQDDLLAGKKRVTPYWRTLKLNGELNPKYPGGIAAQRTRLEAEGHTVIRKGAKYFVREYAKRLVKP